MDHQPEYTVVGGDIPALVWRGAGSGPRPAIITVHGHNGHKGDIAGDAGVAWAAAQGITVVSIDAHLHGDRAGDDSDAGNQFRFLDIIERTAQDLHRVVADLHTDGAVDTGRIGLRGGSMGGYIILAAAGMGISAQALLCICGGASYIEAFPWMFRDQPERLQEIADAMPELTRRAHRFDPIYHVDAIPPRPILFIHGERDPVVPIHCTRPLFEALVPHYADHPGDCLYLSHAGDHATPQSLEDFGWVWLARRLGALESGRSSSR